MKIRIALIATTALALAACGDRNTASTTMSSTETTTTEAANDIGNSEPVNAVQDAVGGVVGQATAATANSVDAYVTNAAMSDMYEREASKIALERSKSAAVKKFAQQMITDHTATTAEVKTILTSGKLALTPPAALDARRKGFIENLRAAPAADFDKVYLDQQVAAHKEALTLHKSYVDDGDNAALKTFAAKTAPKVQMHLDMVQRLDDAA